jgi:ethanolamine utilization protein EutL
MAILDPIKPTVLSVKVIPQVGADLARDLQLGEGQVSIGMITASSDDALYASLDEGTKAANVEVAYGRSFYAGSGHASGPLSGEVIGILAGSDPSEIESGLSATITYLAEKAWFYSADDRDATIFFPHVIPAVGRYLAGLAGVEVGSSLAYLIAPPIEAMYAMDAALKAAEVRLCKLFPPPAETNFAGGLFSGDLNACLAAAQAFQEAVLAVAREPLAPFDDIRSLRPYLPKGRATGVAAASPLRFVRADTGERLAEKPDHFTHLHGMTLVPKSHPRIEFRGELDALQSDLIEAQCLAAEHGERGLVEDLGAVLTYLREMLASEYTGRSLPAFSLHGLSADQWREASHHPEGCPGGEARHAAPDHMQGPVATRLNWLRTRVRQVEVVAARTFLVGRDGCTRPDVLKALNRLSSAMYVLYCRQVATHE